MNQNIKDKKNYETTTTTTTVIDLENETSVPESDDDDEMDLSSTSNSDSDTGFLHFNTFPFHTPTFRFQRYSNNNKKKSQQKSITEKLKKCEPTLKKQQNKEETINYEEEGPFPEDVMILIFSHLTNNIDRLSLALTCKQFMDIFKKIVGFVKTTIYHNSSLKFVQSKSMEKHVPLDTIESKHFYITELDYKTHISFTDHMLLFGKNLGRHAVRGRVFGVTAAVILMPNDNKEIAIVPLDMKSTKSILPSELINSFFPKSSIYDDRLSQKQTSNLGLKLCPLLKEKYIYTKFIIHPQEDR